MQWTSTGKIDGKHCIPVIEPALTWRDSYICFNEDYGVIRSTTGQITGMHCTNTYESADMVTFGTW